MLTLNRYDSEDSASGVGGCGLHSDGKFSLYPAAEHLWTLEDVDTLKESYDWTTALYGRHGMRCPRFPAKQIARMKTNLRRGSTCENQEREEESKEEQEKEEEMEEGEDEENDDSIYGEYEKLKGQWYLKEYPSAYIPLNQRMEMVESLYEPHRGECNSVLHCEMKGCSYVSTQRLFVFDLVVALEVEEKEKEKEGTRKERESGKRRKRRKEEVRRRVWSRCAIFGGGRFFPLQMKEFCECVFKRIEVGVRIQDSSTNPLFSLMKGIDPKYKYLLDTENSAKCACDLRTPTATHAETTTSPTCGNNRTLQIEWRTFCCCREGEVVATTVAGIRSVSGRADCPPQGTFSLFLSLSLSLSLSRYPLFYLSLILSLFLFLSPFPLSLSLSHSPLYLRLIYL